MVAGARNQHSLQLWRPSFAREEHDASATMHGRILFKDGSAQVVEALDQSSPSESLRDDPGRRLSSELLRGHAVGVGHIDDRLSLPARQRLRDLLVRIETDSQEENVRLDCFRQCFGNDRGADRGRIRRKAFRVARRCNGYFDAVTGERPGKRVTDLAEADNCITHNVSPIRR